MLNWIRNMFESESWFAMVPMAILLVSVKIWPVYLVAISIFIGAKIW